MSEPIILRDDSTGATARILPALGFNCYSFAPVIDGEPVETLWSETDFASGKCKPSRSGIPILFPFAGRIEGDGFDFRGIRYPLKINDKSNKNAIHGFAIDRPWKTLETTGSRAVGQFSGKAAGEGGEFSWPASFQITVTYELAKGALEAAYDISNPGTHELPFWLGMHGYFRVPFGAKGAADDCVVTVPAKESWELAELLPTGQKSRDERLLRGARFGDTNFDDAFTALEVKDDWIFTSVTDPANACELRVDFTDNFEHCVVFQPPHREAVCIEPYTAVPNAFKLEAAGVKSGLRLLAPGETFQGRMRISLESSAKNSRR